MTILLMAVTGAAIGFVSSGFVAGGRGTGMVQTTLLTAFGYTLGALTGPLFGFGTLTQWLIGIALGGSLVTAYVIFRAIKERKDTGGASPETRAAT